MLFIFFFSWKKLPHLSSQGCETPGIIYFYFANKKIIFIKKYENNIIILIHARVRSPQVKGVKYIFFVFYTIYC